MVKGHQQQQQRRVHHGATTLQIKSGFAHLITVCAAISLPEKGIRLRWRNKGRQGVRGPKREKKKFHELVLHKNTKFSLCTRSMVYSEQCPKDNKTTTPGDGKKRENYNSDDGRCTRAIQTKHAGILATPRPITDKEEGER